MKSLACCESNDYLEFELNPVKLMQFYLSFQILIRMVTQTLIMALVVLIVKCLFTLVLILKSFSKKRIITILESESTS